MSNYDVIVIGAGSAGLTSAIYSARGGLKTAVIEKGLYGGQLQNTGDIENYTGFQKTTGAELSEHMYNQAIEQGVEYVFGEVKRIDHVYETIEDMIEDRGKKYFVVLDDGKRIETKAVIIATGVQHRHLGVDGEEELAGRGVSYCAICDGAFFKGGHVAVIGGGDSALEEANYLAGIADEVTIIHRRDKFKGQQVLQDRALSNDNVDVLYDTQVKEIIGDDKVSRLTFVHNDDKQIEFRLDVDGVFVYVGLDPITEPFKNLGIVNYKGYIETDENMQTSVAGIFAVGDVREKTVRQIATAVGDGAIAGTYVRTYIDSLED